MLRVPPPRVLVWAAFVMGLFSVSSYADSWSHWRGPTGNGTSDSASPPTEWSTTQNVKWKVRIPGRGSGSPIVWEDRVFVVTAVQAGGPSGSLQKGAGPTLQRSGPPQIQRGGRGAGGNRGGFGRGRGGAGRGGFGGASQLTNLAFKVMAFDRASGRQLWEQTAVTATPHQGTHSTNGFASASPCTDGEHVYAHFGSRGLFCYTMDGNLVWKRTDLGKMTTRNSFGEGSSPTLAGDMILVPWDHEGPSYLYALDKRSGATIWKTARDEPTNWSTPLVIDHEGGQQVVLNGQNCARGYDLATGKELWRCGGQTERPVATAVSDNGRVFVGSGFRGSFLGAFDLNGKGDLEGTRSVAWTIERDTPDIASPILSGGRLYFHKGKTGILTCVDAATGKPFYDAARIPGINSTYASPVAAGGYVFLTGRSGTTVVIKDSETLEIVATNSVGEGVDATPALADQEMFIRGSEHLFCIAK